MTARISQGRLSELWRCRDEVLGRQVAAKILRPALAADPAVCATFRQAAISAAKLTHSNIASVFDTGEQDGTPFIVLEHLEGGSLRDRLIQGPLPPETIARIGADIAAALSHAHRRGVVHGDLRPENVLFTPAGHLKVADFALERAARANPILTDPAGLQAANPYTPPRIARGEEPDAGTDLFSLGVLLYECACGMTPSAAAALAAASGEGGQPRPAALRPDLPAGLDRVVCGALGWDPRPEPGSARSVERVLRDLVDDQATEAIPPAVARRPVPGVNRATGREAAPDRRPQRAAAPDRRALDRRSGGPDRRDKGDSFLRTEGRWLVPALLIIAAGTALVLAIPSLRTGISEVVGQQGSRAAPLEVAAVEAWDPPPGDGEEGTRRLPDAADGDTSTSWATSSYSRANLGGLKDGVGIYVDLGRAAELTALEVSSVTGGWEGTLRYSDDARRWSDPGPPQSVGAEHTFEATGRHRYWMVWITNLVLTDGEGSAQNPWAVAISEIVPIGTV